MKSRVALRTSSSTRSALRAMAAADPSPAAVMTWARGLTRFPATQTPGTLVRPVASVAHPAVIVEVAAEADEQFVVRHEARRDEQRVARHDTAVAHLDTAQLVVGDDQLLDGALDDADLRGRSAGSARWR